jgi:hypothetical protein
MIEEIERLLEQYRVWLKDRTSLRQLHDWVEITTPYLDRHNDYLQIYAQRQNGGFLLSDDGYVLDDLASSGCVLESAKRRKLLEATLNGFGVRQNGSVLEVQATADTFARRKHDLIQAMLAVNDMFYLASPVVASLFLEDVMAWLDLHEIRYTQKVKFIGKTGFDHNFDIVIPKSRAEPERVLQAVNHPDKNAASNLVFGWLDTREARPSNSRAYAMLNDSERPVSAEVLGALSNYGLTPVAWSGREQVRAELAR